MILNIGCSIFLILLCWVIFKVIKECSDTDEAIYTALSIVIGFIVLICLICLFNEISWLATPAKQMKCNLISKNYEGSTVKNRPVTTYNSNRSVGVGIVTTGSSEQYISAFECEGLGSIISDNKEVFTKAKERNILLIKTRKDDYRVEGIKKFEE